VVAEYSVLECESENRILEAHEICRLRFLSRELDKSWSLEEIRMRQRARERNIKEGDRNMTYFHAVVNQRARKKRIEALQGPDGVVHDTHSILKVVANFYKNLFKKEDRGDFRLESDFWCLDDMVTREESLALQVSFSEKEVKEVIFSSYAEGAPDPDGLSFIFYQNFWDLIKNDFCRMIQAFQEGKLDLFRLNFAYLTLIPKVEDVMEMRNFRPISLLICSFKFFSKLLTTRLENVCQRLVAKE
jgi:hypothetical protein